MHYHKDNYYHDDAKAEAYATLLTHQNQFITNSSNQILNQIKKQILSVTAALPQSPPNHRMARQLGFIFGLVGTAFATANAIRISHIENQNLQNQRELHILTHIAEIQEKHLDHLDLKVMANEQQTLEALRYNPALLASTANTLVFQTTDVARVVSATVQQAQMFPNFNTKAFNNTMNSLKETGAISIDYINHEVRQKLNNDKESEDSAKDLIQELKEENHVHPNILLYIVIIVIIIGLTCAFVYIVMNKNNIRPYILYKRRQLTQVPIASNVEAKTRFKDTAFELHNLAESNIYPKLPPLTSSVPV